MAHASSTDDQSHYYVPHSSAFPVWTAMSILLMLGGLGIWLNSMKSGGTPVWYVTAVGFVALACTLYLWYAKVIQENHEGLANAMLKRSYVWGMGWFIFSEVMFFLAFFGALFYARVLVLDWLGDPSSSKGISGEYLWGAGTEDGFKAEWPVMQNPDNTLFEAPHKSMAAPSTVSGWMGYLPFWNTLILVSSSFTVHLAHNAVKAANRSGAVLWLLVTVALGYTFVGLQAFEYYEAYHHYGLTLHSGIYGSTFFLLTGFHGFHVTLGAFILMVQLFRAMKGHFTAEDQFGLEAGSWYWHFVDVVWVCLFFFVYIL